MRFNPLRRAFADRAARRLACLAGLVVLIGAACARDDAAVRAPVVSPPPRPAPAAATGSTDATVNAAARSFVEQELGGERLAEWKCVHRHAISCDSVAVVASFTLDSAQLRGDTARIAVRYRESGDVTQQGTALTYVSRDSLHGQRVDTMVLARAADGWHVLRAARAPRLASKLAMYYFDLTEDDGDRLADDAGIDYHTERRLDLVEPSALLQLPAPIRDSLTARGCRVPQLRGDSTRNVVRGALLGDEPGDWAVLCAIGRSDTILVFPRGGGSPVGLENIAGSIPDPEALPHIDVAGAVYGCAPAIFLVRAADMISSVRESDPSTGPLTVGSLTGTPLTAAERGAKVHDGLGNGDCEGLSNLYYWTGKRWVLFPGGD